MTQMCDLLQSAKQKMQQKTLAETMTAGSEKEDFSVDDFLDGAVRLIQPHKGYRVAMDTVLLAACVPAQKGQKILEGGIGSAGAALCLARRVEGVQITGIERQETMIQYAQRNILFNELQDFVTVQKGDIKDRTGQQGQYDHVMVNPPFLEAGTAHRPPEMNKGLAHMDSYASLKDWVKFCVFHARHKATVSFVYRADRLDELIHHLYGRIGDLHILPIVPYETFPAKRVIVQGRKGTKGATKILPPLVLHTPQERYSEPALEILKYGKPLDLGVRHIGQKINENREAL